MFESMADQLDLPVGVVIGLVVLVVIQLILQIAALIDLARRERVAFDRKWIWVLIIIFVSSGIGAILYFAVGRQSPPATEPAPVTTDEPETHDRARRAVDLLYGPDDGSQHR
jgi:drug/metabolite transporter (DMT)-like permease